MQALDVIFSVQSLWLNIRLCYSRNSSSLPRKDLYHVGKNAQVSGVRSLHADTFAYLSKREWRKRFGEPLICADRSGT